MKADCAFIPRHGFEPSDRTEHARPDKIRTKLVHQPFRLFWITIHNYQPLASLRRAVKGDGPPCTARAEDEHPQVAQVDGKIIANRASESFPVGIKPNECSACDV